MTQAYWEDDGPNSQFILISVWSHILLFMDCMYTIIQTL